MSSQLCILLLKTTVRGVYYAGMRLLWENSHDRAPSKVL